MFEVAFDIELVLKKHSMVASVDRVGKGHLRATTHFLYPDSDSVDLFVPYIEKNFIPVLTDFGRTTEWLFHAQVKTWASKRQDQLQATILNSLGVSHFEGAFSIPFTNENELGNAIIRLEQACIRVSDLVLTKR